MHKLKDTAILPITTSAPFWYKRVADATLVISLAILAVWGSRFFAPSLAQSLLLEVPPYSVVLATLGVVASILTHFVQHNWFMKILSALSYLLALATLGIIIFDAGTIQTPYTGLWLIMSLLVGIFGFAGVGFLLLVDTAYAVYLILYLQVNEETLVLFGLLFVLPVVISYLIWRHNSPHEAEREKEQAYSALAKELSQVTNKSEIVINAIGDGVIAVDSKGIIQLANPAALQITGWGKQDALELDYRSVFKLTDKNDKVPDETADPVQTVLRNNTPVKTKDFSLTTNAGKKINLSLLVSPAGQIGTGAIIVFRNISDEVSENTQKAEFISTASHEMRTPVAAIEGYLGLALNPSTATIDDKAKIFLTKAHESAQHLGRLFQDLLDITKAEDGRMTNNPSIIDVVNFSRDITTTFLQTAKTKDVVLIFQPDTNPTSANLTPIYYANVDPDHFREVLSNLIENGIKYTKQGDVVVDVTGDDTHVVVSVKDTGIGIPAEDVSHLFQKFYRVDNSDTREIGGTGLGLYLSRRLVETMAGRIWVESEYGKGSTFFIQLERIAADEALRHMEESAPTPIIAHSNPNNAKP